MSKLYAERDARALGQDYLNHVMAMTAEGLHAKSDIAAELAFRDVRIRELEAQLADARREAAEAQANFRALHSRLADYIEDKGHSRAAAEELAGACDASALQSAIEQAVAPYREDAERYQYIANACTVILPDGTECEDQAQLDKARNKEKK